MSKSQGNTLQTQHPHQTVRYLGSAGVESHVLNNKEGTEGLNPRRVSSYKDFGIVTNRQQSSKSGGTSSFYPKQRSIDDPTVIQECYNEFSSFRVGATITNM